MRSRLTELLERGAIDGSFARACAEVVARVAAPRLARPMTVPPGVRVLTVGGATWGGSGKTPLAIACARVLAGEAHHDVAFIGHAYGAAPRRARVVAPDDRLEDVGDEALVAARALASARVEVIVAPSRTEAVAFAAGRGARIVVLDGPLQIAPRRADLALLAVDAAHPWGLAREGRGACPPCGDLRAEASDLRAACDEVVPVDDAASRGAWSQATGALVPFADLAARRLGLVTALARPARLEASLARRGIRPLVALHLGDHARGGGRAPPAVRLAELARRHRLEGWLASEKCSLHASGRPAHIDLLVLEHGFSASPALARRVWARFRHANEPSRSLTASGEGNSLFP